MVTEPYLDARILIVDDEPANVRLLERILRHGGYHNIECVNDPRRVLAEFIQKKPDLLLLDLLMPHLNGMAIMEQLNGRMQRNEFVPIVVVTADATRQAREQALAAGAHDFLTKPVDPAEVLLRIRNLLRTRAFYQELQQHNDLLERKVRERTQDLEDAQIEILARLARAAEYRDDETGHHARRVGEYSALVALELRLPPEFAELMRLAAPLHDVGKIGTPDMILLKPAPLTTPEFDEIRNHTAIGAGILAGSRFAVLQLAEEIALYHHESWNGSGYMGLEGELIPLSARIVHVVDVYDALTHVRPYKEAWPEDVALAYLEEQKGQRFDPTVVEAIQTLHKAGKLDMRTPARAIEKRIPVIRSVS